MNDTQPALWPFDAFGDEMDICRRTCFLHANNRVLRSASIEFAAEIENGRFPSKTLAPVGSQGILLSLSSDSFNRYNLKCPVLSVHELSPADSIPMQSISVHPAVPSTMVLPTFITTRTSSNRPETAVSFLSVHEGLVRAFVCDGGKDDKVPKLNRWWTNIRRQMIVKRTTKIAWKVARRRGFIRSQPYKIFIDVDLEYDPREAIKIQKL